MPNLITRHGYSRLALLLALTAGSSVCADETVDFNRDIRPLLADNCFACHGADSGSREADLRLDDREAAIESGALVPGQPDESEFLARVLSEDPELIMPPPETKKQLTKAEKNMLRRWIAGGAEYQTHWAFIPPQKADLPAVQNSTWVRNAVDHFVLSRLEQEGLKPAPEADPRTLFRRLHLDITGLPPVPEDVDAFATDYTARGDAALSENIDRLMSSPAWGEHRARYWLDAARYGDTHGLHFDNYREMWPYRDWVIQSFNRNQPFDEFTVEQLAGDLLPDPTTDQLIATGFQRCNITTNEGGTIDEENMAIYAADRVQTFGWIYLGLTTNCGQCHDHKFDPFTMKDHYSLAAYFRNTTQPAKDGNRKDGRGPVLMVPSTADRERWDSLPSEIAAAKTRQSEYRKAARQDFDQWLVTATSETVDAGVTADGLLAHFPLNEGAGIEVANLCDASGQAIATGEITWSPDGKTGPAPVLRSGATFLVEDLGNFEKNEKFSYGAWVKAGRAGVFGGILARMDEQASYRGWDLWQNDRRLAVHMIDSWPDNGIKVSTTRDVLQPGTWQHIFVTYDGSGQPGGIRIYIDGQAEKLRVDTNTLKRDASIKTGTPFRIGQRSQSQVFDSGATQDVRVYGRELSAAEVNSIANSALLRSTLAIAADKRTDAQTSALYDYYLTTQDSNYNGLVSAVTQLEAEQNAIKSRSPLTHIQEEKQNSPAVAHVLMRGAYDKPGEQVTAAPPAALHALPEGAPPNRLGLARWTVDPENPLTARVTINRFWQEIFGRGIVTTPEDFGTMGAPPSHPELLDWLAVEFREKDWNVQHIFKMVLMSSTYRQAAEATPEKLEKDRHNALVSRGPRFRMDAEMVRDNALATSGLLVRTLYGPPVRPYQPDNIWNMVGLPNGDTRNYVPDKGDGLYRRSLYSFWKRMSPPPNLEAFNAPSREVCTVRRERTNTPLQALVTLNDPQFVEAARALAQTAITNEQNDQAILESISRQVLSRSFSPEEQAILLADKEEFLRHYNSHSSEAAALTAVGETPTKSEIDPPLLAAWTMVCNQILNLDETLNK